MHRKRVVVAAVFIPLFIFLVKYLPVWAFFIFSLAGILWGLYEFYRFYYPDEQKYEILLGILASLALALIFYRQAWSLDHKWITVLIMVALVSQVLLRKDMKSALTDAAVLLLGVFYVGWLLGHVILLRNFNDGVNLIFYVFLVTWSCDAAAYYVGKQWGKRALASRVSPNKTVEGAIGGLAVGLGASLTAHWAFLPEISIWDSVVLGLVLPVLGQIGDLVESVLKRSAGVKDSGRLLPAHGGILDKVDGLIFTAPTFYYYLVWVKQY